MPDNLHVARQGPARSGEVIITDSEKHNDDPAWMEEREYRRIACHFFNQFLELKLALDQGTVTKPVNYEKELRQYKRAAEEFKTAAANLAKDVKRLEDELLRSEEEVVQARGQVNELLITVASLREKLSGLGIVRREEERSGYRFTEHMSPESRRAFESLMKEVPYGGSKNA
jgi:chromosome segregation ATPase